MAEKVRHRRGVSQPLVVPEKGDWDGLIAFLQAQAKQTNDLTDELDRVRRLAGVKPLRKI
jgi:hypothetical protein